MTTVATQCAEKTQIDFSKVDECTKSQLGNQLQHINAVRTENLQPQHQYVPWVTINGQHTEQIEREAERNLVQLICRTYKVIHLQLIYQMNYNTCFRDPIHLLHAVNISKLCEKIIFLNFLFIS